VNQLELPEEHVAIFSEGLAAPGDKGNIGIKINEVFFTNWVMTYFPVHVSRKVSRKTQMDPLLLASTWCKALFALSCAVNRCSHR